MISVICRAHREAAAGWGDGGGGVGGGDDEDEEDDGGQSWFPVPVCLMLHWGFSSADD